MCTEEKLMEEIDLSAEQRAFADAARKLADKIRAESARVGYDLEAACTLVQDGNLTVHTILAGEPEGFVGLPAEVGLYLTAAACGGLFPQPPQPPKQ
jgi:hypothetical protein